MATNVFISYRRDDTRDSAGRVADRLRASSGIGEVFLDVAGIEPGADFPSRIESALADSDVCLVMIGRDWAGRLGETGRTRIHEDGDFVRLEVRTALANDIRVLPVVVHDAKMPDAATLPAELQKVTRLHAIAIRHDSFDRDAEYLVDVILRRRKPSTFGAYLNRHPVQGALLRGGAGFVLAAVALVLAAALHMAVAGKSLDQVLGGPGPVLLLILVVLAAGTALPFAIGRRRDGGG